MTQAQIKGSTTAVQLWRRYKEAGFYLSFGPEPIRFVRSLWERLAGTGQPIRLEEALQLADGAGYSREEALSLLEWTAERGDDGELRGVFALSLNEHPHELEVFGNTLHTWCAQDALFVVPALGEPAVIRSRDPETSRPIRLRSDDGLRVSSVEPASAVVSMIVGKQEPRSILEVWSMFCHHIHFFESSDSARTFLSRREGEFYWLTVDEAMAFGDAIFNADAALRRESATPSEVQR